MKATASVPRGLAMADMPCGAQLAQGILACLVRRRDGFEYKTTCCPIRIDGEHPQSSLGSPRPGEHTEKLVQEFSLGYFSVIRIDF